MILLTFLKCVLFKLLTSVAVHKWVAEIQEGIFNMLTLLVDLVVARLHHHPVSLVLMDTLNLVRVKYSFLTFLYELIGAFQVLVT